jgi:hypothetical protein
MVPQCPDVMVDMEDAEESKDEEEVSVQPVQYWPSEVNVWTRFGAHEVCLKSESTTGLITVRELELRSCSTFQARTLDNTLLVLI